MLKAAEVVVDTRVAAISLWEPWATLMAIGAKKNETRSWPTRHRGALLICAAARKNKRDLEMLLRDQPFYAALAGGLTRLWHGHAVALVDLEQIGTTNSIIRCAASWKWPEEGSDEFHFGDYSPNRFAWITTGLRRLKPFPVKGKRGIFYVTMPEFGDFS